LIARLGAVDRTNCVRLAAPIFDPHRYHQLGVPEDHQIGAVGRDQDLPPLLGPLEMANHRISDVAPIEVILGLIQDQRLVSLGAENEAQQYLALLSGGELVE
jgi:hypothetical protein